MAAILIVDDDSQLRQSFEKLLRGEGHSPLTASSGEDGVDAVRRYSPDLVIIDVRLPGIDGLEAFRRMRDEAPDLPVIIMTAHGTTDMAIEATKLGAYDYVLKPFEIPDMLALIDRALTSSGESPPASVPVSDAEGSLLGRSPAMQEVCKAVGRAAPTDATILIRGESGTGKELIAKALHRHSLRFEQPFQVINCVAIPETLLESELFGYERGAFTGAGNRRIGKIEQAARGTVFLDEIGDMPLSIQAKLLRLLQERQIERLGGQRPIPVDVRIIAATNRDLEQAVASGEFREDLYYRLKVVTISLPPLRDRAEDIPLLTDHLLADFAGKMRLPLPALSEKARAMLREYQWPGNVRELSNIVQNLLIFSPGGTVCDSDVHRALGLQPSENNGIPGDASPEEVVSRWVRRELASYEGSDAFDHLMDHFGAVIIREALNIAEGNRSKAARLLGVSRPTLHSRIDRYGLTIKSSTS